MKKLDVRLVVNANNIHEAEAIAQRELMGLAKLIGMKSGSSIGSCKGDTLSLGCRTYQVAALIEIDGNGDVNGAIAGVQNEWNMRSEIMSSSIFVTEEKHEETPKPATIVCANCGQILMKGSEYTVNPETTNEYYLCDDCFEVAVDNGVIEHCGHCTRFISKDELVENPVTHKAVLCPYCGADTDYI